MLAKDEGARATFLVEADGERRAPRAGEWFRNPDYARTLREIARARPSSLEALRGIAGVGARKLEAYGTEIVALVR